MKTDQAKALEIIKDAQNILIVPSTPMDGDSVGSALAMMKVLRRLGKQVTVAAAEEVPDVLLFLPFTDQIQTDTTFSKDFVISLNTQEAEVDHLKYEVEQGKINIIVTPKHGQFSGHDITFGKGQANFDLIIAVDTGDLVQLGKVRTENPELFENTPLLNIDHHSSNGMFGSYNFVDSSVAATTQILTPLIQAMEKEFGQELIDEDVATLLLVGIITDTGSFQHTNTSPEAFEVAADLLECGARQQEIIKHIFKTKSLATLKLWGQVLSKIHYDNEVKLVYSTITLEDLARTGADSADSGGIIDELMTNAPDAEVVMLLKEKEPGYVSGSLRAPGQLADVAEIAKKMNGGGHKKAAGFRIYEKSMPEALAFAKNVVTQYMREKLQPEVVPESHPIQEIEQKSEQPQTNRLFPNLVVKPQTSIPAPLPGGEDLLLQDFRKRQQSQNPEEQRIKETSTKFFQDADGQEKSAEEKAQNAEPTVGDMLGLI